MAGIYIHIPYCKTRCIYCDFFTQTNMKTKPSLTRALSREIELRKEYVGEETIDTIYFGGGTPSQLEKEDFLIIFDAIANSYRVNTDAEITMEANPDDLTSEYIQIIRTLPFNRISIGVQSFDDSELKFLNRRHSAQRAKDAVEAMQNSGISNISIDLMYGLPNQSMEVWEKNLDEAINLNVPHISSYHLIYEEGTKLFSLREQGKVRTADEELSVEMFAKMIETLDRAGFEHYEISNFAKSGLYSKHNTSYWLGTKYLGIGPAAHSFDGVNRAENIHSIHKYIDAIDKKAPAIEIEILEESTRYNDFILTGLRTMWGVDLAKLESLFGDKYLNYCLKNAQKHLFNQHLKLERNQLTITKAGIFISDAIMSDLMWV